MFMVSLYLTWVDLNWMTWLQYKKKNEYFIVSIFFCVPKLSFTIAFVVNTNIRQVERLHEIDWELRTWDALFVA